jgi:DNA-binding transcriptional regulator YhcF (GntR family)
MRSGYAGRVSTLTLAGMAATISQGAGKALRERIASGDLKPGDHLGPSLGAIARDYGVGKTTMQGVLKALDAQGVIRSVQGVGYFIADDARERLAAAGDGDVPGWARKLQEDVADLKADVAELQSRRGIDRPARKRERSNEQSG